MSAVGGGSPVRLTKSEAHTEFAGSWSPDGNWFVYWSLKDGRTSLNKVKTTGQAAPEVLKPDVNRHGFCGAIVVAHGRVDLALRWRRKADLAGWQDNQGRLAEECHRLWILG